MATTAESEPLVGNVNNYGSSTPQNQLYKKNTTNESSIIERNKYSILYLLLSLSTFFLFVIHDH